MSDLLDRVGTKDIARNKQTLSGKEKGVLSLRYVALIFLVFFAIAPIYIMVVNSFKGISGVSQSAAWSIPTHLDFAAWGPVWDNLKGSMGRTLFFVVQSSIISAIVGSINGYVTKLAKDDFVHLAAFDNKYDVVRDMKVEDWVDRDQIHMRFVVSID